MTKQAKAVLAESVAAAPEAQAAAPATTVGKVTPDYIQLHAPIYSVLQTAAALIRQGYVPSSDTRSFPPMVMGDTLTFMMVKGNPDDYAQKAADAAVAEALEQQEVQRQKDIEAAAVRLLEVKAQEEARAKLQAEIDEDYLALRRKRYELSKKEEALGLKEAQLEAA